MGRRTPRMAAADQGADCMNRVQPCTDHADASLRLAEAITLRFGVDALDELVVEAFKCPHEGSDRSGTVLAAWPRREGAALVDLIIVYYGDPPERVP